LPALKLKTDDEVEMEEQLHDHDGMSSMSVIENEIHVMGILIKKSSGSEKDFFTQKLSSL